MESCDLSHTFKVIEERFSKKISQSFYSAIAKDFVSREQLDLVLPFLEKIDDKSVKDVFFEQLVKGHLKIVKQLEDKKASYEQIRQEYDQAFSFVAKISNNKTKDSLYKDSLYNELFDIYLQKHEFLKAKTLIEENFNNQKDVQQRLWELLAREMLKMEKETNKKQEREWIRTAIQRIENQEIKLELSLNLLDCYLMHNETPQATAFIISPLGLVQNNRNNLLANYAQKLFGKGKEERLTARSIIGKIENAEKKVELFVQLFKWHCNEKELKEAFSITKQGWLGQERQRLLTLELIETFS